MGYSDIASKLRLVGDQVGELMVHLNVTTRMAGVPEAPDEALRGLLVPSQTSSWHDTRSSYIQCGWKRRILEAGGPSSTEDNDHTFFITTFAINMDRQSFQSSGAVFGILLGLVPQLVLSQVLNLLKIVWNYKGRVIEIPITDPFFPSVMKWASEQVWLNSGRNLVATSDKSVWFPTSRRISDADTSLHQVVFAPNYGRHHFFHDGHWIQFERLPYQGGPGQTVERIEFSMRGKNGQFLKDFIQQIYKSYHNEDGKVMVYQARVVDKKAEWIEACSTSRAIDTVFVNPQILKDAEIFFSDHEKTRYQRKSQRHRRGYLFYGPPGTGKSSLSEAIATRFRLPIYQISLDSKEITSSHLQALLGGLREECVLLLEDVPVAGTSVQNQSWSYSALLNLVDGVGAQEDRLLIVTTNDLDESQFNEALTRPGRIDLKFKFGNADAECLRQLFLLLVDNESEADIRRLAEDFAHPGKALKLVEDWVASSSGSIGSGEKGFKADDSEPQPVLED
ncbi:putative mitochondrial chaperone BCS1-A [Colletotrichum fructicola Nara gc5]|uniref:Putative mitochondrial chaperone BCS1-A n=1 Tax=Colletotrichum fructicola (strain Nara gc5) TaxID=1213859 RepID=A0A7J6J8K5_COLFN|nr:putative mitochondrial chaperone BCS1-A [Colletotrichum fructicola Nara gc5]